MYDMHDGLLPAILFECCKAEVLEAPDLPGGVQGDCLRAFFFFKWKSVGKKLAPNK